MLAILGDGWTGYGIWGVLGDPRYGTGRGLDSVTHWVPMSVLGWVWVACGALSIVSAVPPAGRCPRLQSFGFVALAMPAALWGTAYLTAKVTGAYPKGAGSACGWLGFALAIVWISGMDDAEPSRGEARAWTRERSAKQ
ncbi:hypothetical protein [Streptomyces sp. NPDC046985]|uniref:hypothetical protein n=1 Tax=Streptomyces sp. NPDC046985 TaxID=3155377 RepID=UPI0033ED9BCF